MFSHIMIGANDLAAAKSFYDASLGALGIPEAAVDAKGRLTYVQGENRLMVTKPLDAAPATGANGGTIGFYASSPEAADAWHAAGLANGGIACEDGPGARHLADGRVLYLAYLRDPSGNKLCALHRVV